MKFDGIFSAHVSEEGNIDKFYSKRAFDEAIKRHAGKDIEIAIRRKSKKRSLQENAFYWFIYIQSQIDCFKERWGGEYTKEQIHDWNKSNIWCFEQLIGDEVVKIPESSTIYSPSEWEERLELGRIFFREKFDWQLPYPNEQAEMEF